MSPTLLDEDLLHPISSSSAPLYERNAVGRAEMMQDGLRPRPIVPGYLPTRWSPGQLTKPGHIDPFSRLALPTATEVEKRRPFHRSRTRKQNGQFRPDSYAAAPAGSSLPGRIWPAGDRSWDIPNTIRGSETRSRGTTSVRTPVATAIGTRCRRAPLRALLAAAVLPLTHEEVTSPVHLWHCA
jgi:hypothetical protein